MTEHSAVAVAPARLRLLGGWQLIVDGVEVELGHREQRLVALLGLADLQRPGPGRQHAVAREHRRARPGQPAPSRAPVPARGAPACWSPVGRPSPSTPGVQVDVDDLRRAAGLTRLPMTDAVARELLDALRGAELLPGWFDDWVVEERARARAAAGRGPRARRAARAATRATSRWPSTRPGSASEIEPLREPPRELAIRAHLGRGDVAGARARAPALRAPCWRTSSASRRPTGSGPASSRRSTPPRRSTLPAPRPSRVPPAAHAVDPPTEATAGCRRHLARWTPRRVARQAAVRQRRTPGGGGTRGRGGRRTGRRRSSVALTRTRPPPQATERPAGDRPADRVAPVDPAPARQPSPDRPRAARRRPPTASAAFAVRASRCPAEVRLVVRGRGRPARRTPPRGAGPRTGVTSSSTASIPAPTRGRRPSATAAPVSGEVSVTPPADEEAAARGRAVGQRDTRRHAGDVARPEPPRPRPTPAPTPTPRRPSHAEPDAAPRVRRRARPRRTSPTGTPTDPGTVAPTPVG